MQVGVTPGPQDATSRIGRVLDRKGFCVHSTREPLLQGRHSWEKRHLREVENLRAQMGQGIKC